MIHQVSIGRTRYHLGYHSIETIFFHFMSFFYKTVIIKFNQLLYKNNFTWGSLVNKIYNFGWVKANLYLNATIFLCSHLLSYSLQFHSTFSNIFNDLSDIFCSSIYQQCRFSYRYISNWVNNIINKFIITKKNY